MSTAIAHVDPVEESLIAYNEAMRSLERYDLEHPRESAVKFRHQQAVYDLICLNRHPLTGEPLKRKASEVVLVAPNQCGKTEIGGLVIDTLANLESPRVRAPGWIWTGAETLSVSTSTVEEKLESYLGRGEVVRWVNKGNDNGESVVHLKNGMRIRSKSYDQGRKRWQGVPIMAALIDEQPPNDVVQELRMRCVRYGAPILYTFTALGGISSTLYDEFYVPFTAYMLEHGYATGEVCHVCGWEERGPHAVEVSPGRWVVTARMRDNTFLDLEDVDAKEAALIASGRISEARVRFHGEWLDIGEDPLIPIDSQKEWETPPRNGYTANCYWLDGAFSVAAEACRSSVAYAGRRPNGQIDLIGSRGGKWTPTERNEQIVAMVREHGDAPAYVQRTTVDSAIAWAVNQALAQAGCSTRFIEWPPTGTGQKVLGKLERAQQFSPLVASGVFRCHASHAEYKKQAGLATADLLKKGARTGVPIDDLDAVMGATMRLFQGAMPAGYEAALAEGEKGGWSGKSAPADHDMASDWGDEEPVDDWAYQGDIMGEVD